VAAARAGDGAAIAAVGRAGSALGAALAGAIGLLDPAVVVVSGGVAAALDVLEPAVRACLHRQLPEHLRTVPIVAGDFGPDAGLVGALVAAGRGAMWWEAP
jgi:glucokinase